MKKTILIIMIALLLTTPALAAYRERVGEKINILEGTPDTFPAGEPFHIAHGWAGVVPVPMLFKLEVDGVNVGYDFIEKTVDSEEPLLITKKWVFNFPEGMTGTHTFQGDWMLACSYAVSLGIYQDTCPSPKELVSVLSNTLVVEFYEDS